MMQTFEQWQQQQRDEILSRFPDDMSFEEKLEQMTPDERLKFMTAQEIAALNNKTTKQFLSKNKSLTLDEHLEKKAIEFVEQVSSKKHLAPVSEEKRQKMNEYYQKIKTEPRKRGFKQAKKRVGLMDYDRARKIFYHQYLVNSFKDKRKKFVTDSFNEVTIAKLLMYFVGDERCESETFFENPISLNKSIFLFGPIHTGKTNLMTQFSKFTTDYQLETAFQMNSFIDTVAHCEAEGSKYLFKFKNQAFCHDELVFKDVHHFKTTFNPAESLIMQQYNQFNNIGIYTHFTSNANPDEILRGNSYEDIKPLLKPRERARFENMYNFVCLGGDSRI